MAPSFYVKSTKLNACSELDTTNTNTTLIESINGFPELLPLHDQFPERYPFLLESVARGHSARYDILFAFPGETLQLNGDDSLQFNNQSLEQNNFLDELDSWWKKEQVPSTSDYSLPFSGGWFLYLAYELARQVEPKLKLPRNTSAMPDAFATRIPSAIIRDHSSQQCWIISEVEHSDNIELIRTDINAPQDSATNSAVLNTDISEEAEQQYLQAIERIHDYIVEGDVFQVNLSRQWQATINTDITNTQLYQSLKDNNPAPFAGLVTFNDYCVISSSPERLVNVHQGQVDTRPIAGTRPRDTKQESDRALSDELLSHPKECAEHIMLIDLERNDLGRICQPGSINVNELMVLESYAHVHHIVSNVQGELCTDTTPGQVIAAVFPGGTITGCPKVRCMEIIAELEQSPRGAYTGSMGYLNRDGNMDLNILIRTMTRNQGTISLRAGAGIVADSVPENELNETRAKAKGLLNALANESNT